MFMIHEQTKNRINFLSALVLSCMLASDIQTLPHVMVCFRDVKLRQNIGLMRFFMH